MILIDLWEWAINLFLVGCGVLILSIGSFIFVLLINVLSNWSTK